MSSSDEEARVPGDEEEQELDESLISRAEEIVRQRKRSKRKLEKAQGSELRQSSSAPDVGKTSKKKIRVRTNSTHSDKAKEPPIPTSKVNLPIPQEIHTLSPPRRIKKDHKLKENNMRSSSPMKLNKYRKKTANVLRRCGTHSDLSNERKHCRNAKTSNSLFYTFRLALCESNSSMLRTVLQFSSSQQAKTSVDLLLAVAEIVLYDKVTFPFLSALLQDEEIDDSMQWELFCAHDGETELFSPLTERSLDVSWWHLAIAITMSVLVKSTFFLAAVKVLVSKLEGKEPSTFKVHKCLSLISIFFKEIQNRKSLFTSSFVNVLADIKNLIIEHVPAGSDVVFGLSRIVILAMFGLLSEPRKWRFTLRLYFLPCCANLFAYFYNVVVDLPSQTQETLQIVANILHMATLTKNLQVHNSIGKQVASGICGQIRDIMQECENPSEFSRLLAFDVTVSIQCTYKYILKHFEALWEYIVQRSPSLTRSFLPFALVSVESLRAEVSHGTQ